jgi:predicted RNase H-like HicB family nuclease
MLSIDNGVGSNWLLEYNDLAVTEWRQGMALQHTVKAIIRKGEKQYVAECIEIGVVTQGASIAETLENLQEAVALHLEGEDLAELGLAPDPSILVTMEMELERRVA